MAVAGSLTYKAELDEKEFDSKYAKFQNVLATGGKAIAASMAAAGAAIIAIGTNAIQSYADYEQLVGGAQLMFGDAYNFIADKAANAYATVQMSQNDYLQQVNGFAVGLKTALGGNAQAAAELADKIVTAEADVVAATGNSQEAVQAAFNGIMKSNFTMLDNLQLGIKPTKEGMQEVIDKVNEWNTANGKATSYQIDNLADCQSALVDYIEMQGIAGYAANEAADTIQGTLASVKGAWENLLTGLADDNADFETLIGNLVDSIVNLAGNLIPRIKNVLEGIGGLISGLIQELGPTILEMLPDLIDQFIEIIIQTIEAIMPAIAEFIPKVIQLLVEQLPNVIALGSTIIVQLLEGIAQALPQLIAMLPTIITQMITTLLEYLPDIIVAGLDILIALIEGIVQAIPQLIEMLPTIIEAIVNTLLNPDMIGKLVEAAIRIVIALGVGMVQNIPKLVAMIPQIIDSIVKAFINMDWGSLGRNVLQGILNGFSNAGNLIWDAIKSVGNSMLSGIKAFFGIASPAKKTMPLGKYTAQGVAVGYKDGEDDILDSIDDVNKDVYKELEKSVNIETGNIVGKAFITANNSGYQIIENHVEVGDVVLDGKKVGQATTPYVVKTMKAVGVR